MDVDMLADKAGLHRESLYRVMRALAVDGVFIEHSRRLFGHTPLSLAMVDPSARSVVQMFTGYAFYNGSDNMRETIRTGYTHIGKSLKCNTIWDFNAANPQEQELFARGMVGMSYLQDLESTVHLGDYSKFETVVDLGGSHGKLISEILKQNSNIKQGINFDLKDVFEKTAARTTSDP
eukprot:gene20256-24288_t